MQQHTERLAQLVVIWQRYLLDTLCRLASMAVSEPRKRYRSIILPVINTPAKEAPFANQQNQAISLLFVYLLHNWPPQALHVHAAKPLQE
jgi:hypothetical protein